MTHGYDDVEASNKQIVEASFARWVKGAGTPFEDLAANAKWTVVGNSPVSRMFNSREEYMAEVIGPFNARMSSPLVPSVKGVYADGDMVVVLFDGKGTARDGKPYANSYAWFLQMRDDQIVKVTAFFDTTAFNDLWTRVTPAA